MTEPPFDEVVKALYHVVLVGDSGHLVLMRKQVSMSEASAGLSCKESTLVNADNLLRSDLKQWMSLEGVSVVEWVVNGLRREEEPQSRLY